MKGLVFETLTPPVAAATNRADIACFIGLAEVRPGAVVPEDLKRSLQQEGWWPSDVAAGAELSLLYQRPLPIASWERFDQLFAWDQRPYASEGATRPPTLGASYLGAAVRSFFAQGGRSCYVLSLGAPLALAADRASRDAMLLRLVPPTSGQRIPRGDWQGLQHLLGLPEVSFVTLPDVAELVGLYQQEALESNILPLSIPQFVPCAQQEAAQDQASRVVQLATPACTDEDYLRWRAVIHRAALFVATHRRDVQLLASLPLPHPQSSAAAGLLAFVHQQGWLSGALADENCPLLDASATETTMSACSLASAFVQLGYPWLRTGYGGDLPGNVEPPEGAMAGLLARNALTRGTFRNASGLEVYELISVQPVLRSSQQFGINPKAPPQASPQAPLIDRVSLFGPTPQGLRLLSDVTTHNQVGYRQASINRTIALVMRAAHSIGEEYVFEASGERLWARLQARMEDVLGAMQRVGALSGSASETAFSVRCDRSTMSQQDIDSGRVIVQVLIRPAAGIETMRIQLAMGDGGHLSLASLGMEAA